MPPLERWCWTERAIGQVAIILFRMRMISGLARSSLDWSHCLLVRYTDDAPRIYKMFYKCNIVCCVSLAPHTIWSGEVSSRIQVILIQCSKLNFCFVVEWLPCFRIIVDNMHVDNWELQGLNNKEIDNLFTSLIPIEITDWNVCLFIAAIKSIKAQLMFHDVWKHFFVNLQELI